MFGKYFHKLLLELYNFRIKPSNKITFLQHGAIRFSAIVLTSSDGSVRVLLVTFKFNTHQSTKTQKEARKSIIRIFLITL